MSQSEDAYAPEEPTPDIPISLLDVQMPETPESTKGQASDGDIPRLESPKLLKPVLGKVQAKKRLMAFANKFNMLPKVQNKSNLLQSYSTKVAKSKSTSSEGGKSLQTDSSIGLNVDSDSAQFQNRQSSGGSKSKKKAEEKILAIEEIRREESKSKMLLAEAMAAASLEEENYANRNGQNLLENVKIIRERSRQDEASVSHKSTSKSSIESKYSERKRYAKEERRDSVNREAKDYNGSKERYYKSSHDKEQRRKDKDKKDDKRDDSSKYEDNRDKKDEERDIKKDTEKDKWEEIREKKGAKDKRESSKDKKNDSQETTSEIKDKKEKEKERDKGKEKDIMNSSSWVELKKCGITMDDMIDIRRRDYSERLTKNRTPEDYLRHFEQMLMLNDCRLKRYPFIAEGPDGPREYPPESIRVTKRGRPQLLYSENPRMSLFMNHEQILQAVTTEHRDKMRVIYEADFTRDNTEEEEKPQRTRNWYPKAGMCKSSGNTDWQVPISVQLPRSKWDSEDEDGSSNDVVKEPESEVKSTAVASEREQGEFSPRLSATEEEVNDDTKKIDEDETSGAKETDDNRQSASPLLQSEGNEKLASEYEQFMKMVCSDIPVTKEFSPKPTTKPSASTISYHEFNIETNLPEDSNYSFVEHSISGKSDKSDSSKIEEKFQAKETRQNLEKMSKMEDDQMSSSSCHIQVQECVRAESKDARDKSESEDSKSIPSDWENVRIKVERLSDENSESREARKKKKKKRRKKDTSSSSDSSSSSSSSDSEEEVKKRKRKRKLSNDSDSLSDTDSSDSSSSSSDSSSSDDKRKKRRKKKRKAEKRKRKAKRIAKAKKKRRRKVSSDSSSSDSSDDKRKKKASSKKSKQKKKYKNKQDNNEDIAKVIQKSALESPPETTKLIRSQAPPKKVKDEVKGESRKRSIDKHDIWVGKEQDLVRKVISNSSMPGKAHKSDEKRSKGDERYLEEWEMEPAMVSQKAEKISKGSVEKMENIEIEKLRKLERKEERSKKEDRSKKDECLKEKHSSINKEIIQSSLKMEEDTEGKKKRKRDKERKNSNEFLADWEKDSERITHQIMQGEIKVSKKADKQKKEKWGETEFDTLNVPSLTQLEREVSKRQLLADEWEVDSLEAVPELMISKRKGARTSKKKIEKEVQYDKKTDTYIAIEKETLKECKKRQDRLSAMRIWEEEQEEGEREAMMLMEQKNKRKKDDWDIEEESFLREKSDRKEGIQSKIPTIDSIHKEVISVNKDVDTSIKHDVVGTRKSKKSRWDMASQSEEKIELKAPVMWEEECAEWTQVNKFLKSDRVSLEHCDPILPKGKVKDEDVCMVEQQTRKSASKNSTSDIIDLFPRKSEDIDLLESSWTPEELTSSKPRMRSLDNSSQRDALFDKAKELMPTKEQRATEQLKDIFEIDVKLTKKNVELYSPSSPAASQKSEDMEVFNESHVSSLNLKEELQEKPKKETLIKSDEESIPNIPLQIKYRDGKYAKPAKEEFEEILGVQKTEEQATSPQKNFEPKVSEPPLLDFPINELCDMNYKPLQMDIFAEYESEQLRGTLSGKSVAPETAPPPVREEPKVEEETNEGKAALKLIPKQLLVRRNNERAKTKLLSEDSMQHAAALLTIQKKLRESHEKKDPESTPCKELSTEFKIECEKTTNIDTPVTEVVPTEQTTITDVKVDSKDLSITVKTSITTKSESSTVKLDFEEYKSGDKGAKVEELKKSRAPSGKDISDTEGPTRSPSKEVKKKSPSRKENKEEKRASDRSKEKREKKFDDRERGDRRDSRSSKDYSESRRRSSPSSSRGKRRRSTSWEREGSRSESHSRSWSRSRSKSPKRKEELASSSSREKRSSRNDEDRSGRARGDDRRERSTRSPRSNKDHFKKHGSAKGDRDEWNRRKYDYAEREKEGRLYDPIEVLRERNAESDRHKEGRFRGEEADRSMWPYESENILREGNESLDSYPNGQDLDLDYEEKTYYRDDSIERDIMEGPFRPSSKFKHRYRYIKII